MEPSLINSIPNIFLGWIGVLTVLVVGGLAVWGLIDRQLRDRRKDALDAADGLINTLQETIDELKGRVKDLEDEHKEHTRQIGEMKATNDTLTKILQGRDENTVAFQHKVLEATGTAKETNGIVKKMEASITTMADAMTRLAAAIEAKEIK